MPNTYAASVNSQYGNPAYFASQSTTNMEARRKGNFTGNFNISSTDTIPFNPDIWRPANGLDSFMTVLDSSSGREWDLWNVSWGSQLAVGGGSYQTSFDNNVGCATNGQNLPPPFGVGYDQNTQLCAASVAELKDPSGNIADYRTYEGNSPLAGGAGLQDYAGLVTASEVQAGEIRHAMKLAIFNTMFGPECPAGTSVTDAAFGTTCGDAVAPAGQFEQVANTTGTSGGSYTLPGATADDRRAQTVPEGMRFAINLTDAQINSWIASKGYTGAEANTARIFATALHDYGFIITDSSGGGGLFGIASAENPDDAARWQALGIVGDGSDLLDGLFTQSDLYAVQPATNTCANGSTSQLYCYASSTGYPN
jgi:hypothetical protein